MGANSTRTGGNGARRGGVGGAHTRRPRRELVGSARGRPRRTTGAMGGGDEGEFGTAWVGWGQRGHGGRAEAGWWVGNRGGRFQEAPPTSIFAEWVPCGWLAPQPPSLKNQRTKKIRNYKLWAFFGQFDGQFDGQFAEFSIVREKGREYLNELYAGRSSTGPERLVKWFSGEPLW